MTKIILALLFLQLQLPAFAQDVGNASKNNEELVQIDTIQISPTIKEMVFKYFRQNDEYPSVSNTVGKQHGRFEIYYLGDKIPFQKDTIDDVIRVAYEDANFDNILDLSIVTTDDVVDYYLYNPISKLFEYEYGGLYNPTINKKDSTISTESHCCMGRSGGGEVYKFIKGKLRLIEKSSYSETGSFKEVLIDNSMVVTILETISSIDNGNFVDSSWSYLFGKLRIVAVTKKKMLEHSPTRTQQDSGLAYQDVMGSFEYLSEESFKYKNIEGENIKCDHLVNEVRNAKWVEVKQDHWFIKK